MRRALAAAAAELWAERGLAVSAREIAAHAGVNHGLVHRHFGGRQGLLRAALNHLVERSQRRLASSGPPTGFADLFAAYAEDSAQARLIMQLLLEDEDPMAYQESFPALEWMEDHLSRAVSDDETDARLRMALLNAAGHAWFLGEDYFLAAAGLEGDREEVRRRLVEIAADWLGTPA